MTAGDVWGRFSADPRESGHARLRANDADRDLVLSVLREAFADGRLTGAEHDERSGAALRCRTIGDVEPLIGDLVTVGRPAARPDRGALHRQAVQRYRRDVRDMRNGWIFVSAVSVVVWTVTALIGGGFYFFWPVLPILGLGFGYLAARLNSEWRVEQHEKRLTLRERRRREMDEGPDGR